MRKPKLREIREAVVALFTGPYTAKFPYGPPLIQENFRGKPEYREEDCIGCAACSEVCPSHAIQVSESVRDGKPYRKLTIDLGICVYCGTCVEKCTTGEGIFQTRLYDVAGLDPAELIETVEKEMVECEICRAAFATRDHLMWIYEKIGPLAAANWTLSLVAEAPLGGENGSAPKGDGKIVRRDHMRILCPECRRKVILAEEWGNYE